MANFTSLNKLMNQDMTKSQEETQSARTGETGTGLPSLQNTLTGPSADVDYSAYGVYEANPQSTLAGIYGANRSGIRTEGSPARPTGAINTSTTTAVRPKGEIPVLSNLPEFKAPEYDESRVDELAQEGLYPVRPLRRELRNVIIQALSANENPNVAKTQIGEAIRGYSEGLSMIAGRAREGARADYAREYGYDYQEATANWQKDINAQLTNFQALMNDYNRSWSTKTTTTSKNIYPETEGSEALEETSLASISPRMSFPAASVFNNN